MWRCGGHLQCTYVLNQRISTSNAQFAVSTATANCGFDIARFGFVGKEKEKEKEKGGRKKEKKRKKKKKKEGERK